MLKRIKWIALAVVCLVLVWCAAAQAETGGTDGNITWSLSDEGVLTISGTGAMKSYGYGYDYINDSYFTNAPWGTSATSVVIENSVTSIGSCAFYGCTSLTGVTIPSSVTSIGNSAFSSCYSLEQINISSIDSWLSIQYGDYHSHPNCNSENCHLYINGQELKNITIPDSVSSIGASAFERCTSLATITIPDSVTSIGASAFESCTSLATITIPDSVTSIGGSAFCNCTSLTSITIPDSVSSICDWTFENCTSLTSITIPDSVTSIGDRAFLGCSNLTGIAIPDSVTSIGDRAFLGCSNLTGITIPDSVTNIGEYAFNGCSRIEQINISSIDSWLSIQYEGNEYDRPNYSSQNCHLYINGQEIKNITIPDSVTSIGDCAFSNCTSLTDITIPDSVTSIGERAFFGCSSLTDITIPDSVTSIGNGAFSSCSSLTNVIIGDGVTSIGDSAFSYCTSLTSITIGDKVTSIGYSAFFYSSSLGQLNISSIDSWLSIKYNDNYSHPNFTDGWHLYINGQEAKKVTIPDSVTSIGTAFQGCASLTDITIPNSVTSIDDRAFSNCTSLTSITIGDSVSSIGDYAFYNCTSLTDITIPDSVTSIGERAFFGCSSLTDITIPNSVTSIDDRAFSNCTSLTSITIGDSVSSIGDYAFYNCTSLTDITIPDSVSSIGDSAFYNCHNLEQINISSIDSWLSIQYGNARSHPNYSQNCRLYINGQEIKNVTIPDSITSIGEYAFYNCTSLTNISIPDSVTSIGEYAFYNCTGLTDITIPDSVTSIGEAAFYYCTGLMDINIPNSVTSIGDHVFQECSNLTNATIGNSVTSIGKRAFYNCSSLSDISIPDGVTSIGSSAFSGCSGLTNISIPDSVISIGEYAFTSCYSLTGITIPDSVTSIGKSAFERCTSLTDITIPESVTSIGEAAFYYCDKLKQVAFTLNDESVDISFGAPFSRYPTVYCYKFSSVDSWALFNRFTIVYLDEINVDEIRTITLPADFRLAIGESRRIVAGLFPDDHEPVTWTSSDPSVVSVTNGFVTALDTGTATITANVGTVSSSVTITSYIPATGFNLNMTEAWLLARNPLQLSVVSYTPANAEADITWNSSDTAKATVDENGLVTTIMPGDVTIMAVTERGVQRSCLIHLFRPVTDVDLTAPYPKMIIGHDMQLNAHVTCGQQSCDNHLVTFTSSDETVATVDIETGVMHGVAPGTVTITASSASGKSSSVEIRVMDECDEHTPVTDEAVAPTCTETGLTEGSHCAVCGEVLVAQVVVSASGHDWGAPDYAWAEDNSTVTAIRVCTNNEEHIETETVSTTSEVTLQPTCTDMGKTTYTSNNFENEAFTVQSRTLTDVAVNPAGHDWGAPTYVWTEDVSSVTATRICAYDEEHAETETVNTTSEVTLLPTCTEMGRTTYTSDAFKNQAFTIQSRTLTDVEATGHDWGAPTYTWAEDNSTVTATRVCANDEEHVETETVNTTSEVTLLPTCTEMGQTTYTSDAFENDVFTIQSRAVSNVDVDPVNHNWGDPTYIWAEDNSTVTATRVCANNAEHVETETVTVQRVVTVSPTQTDEGEFKYVSSAFQNEAFRIQEKDGAAIPALETLSSPVFPANLTVIEDSAFENTSFQAVIIPDTVTSIGSRAFANCLDLVYVYIPAGIASFPDDAFADCPDVVIEHATD